MINKVKVMENINKLREHILRILEYSARDVNLVIYLDDRFYAKLKYELHTLSVSLPATVGTHEQTIMGYKFYRVSPKDNHPDFRVFVEPSDGDKHF